VFGKDKERDEIAKPVFNDGLILRYIALKINTICPRCGKMKDHAEGCAIGKFIEGIEEELRRMPDRAFEYPK